MTTTPTESTSQESPDDQGHLHLAEGTPDPTGPVNTGHGTDPSFAENEDVPGADAE